MKIIDLKNDRVFRDAGGYAKLALAYSISLLCERIIGAFLRLLKQKKLEVNIIAITMTMGGEV